MQPVRDQPAPGQESVWDFPRPAIAQQVTSRLKVMLGSHVLAETTSGVRTIETSHPPTYYFPPSDVDMILLQRSDRTSLCEWKGQAHYFDIVADDRTIPDAAWSYADPTPAFASIRNFIAFYPALMTACFVDGEQAVPQPGRFYGGWITSGFSGPFKGAPGTQGW
jgi:uncharacterized protein (DUF427 family)